MDTPITRDQVARALPATLRTAATQSLADKLNAIDSDPVIAEAMRENFISYSHVLKEGRFKVKDYLNAVKFVSFKLMGLTNDEAYFKTFPDRYQKLLDEGKDTSPYVAMYKKNKLVNLILEQSLVPIWVLNQDKYQKAINVQATLMTTAKSEMVRTQAANSILTHLAKPKEAGPLIAINTHNDGRPSELQQLNDTLVRLAKQQQELVRAGTSPKEIAEDAILVSPTKVESK